MSHQHTGVSDLPLTPNGEDEAVRLGELLAGRTFAVVFTSPLRRAVRTCELAGFASLAVVDPDLTEWNYGTARRHCPTPLPSIRHRTANKTTTSRGDGAGTQLQLTSAIEPKGRVHMELLLEAGKNLLIGLSALFPIVNPLGSSPFFLALTAGYTPQARNALSWRVAINSFFLISASYFVGTSVLHFFGVSVPAVQIGGGLIVIFTGWTMLVQRDDEKDEVQGAIQPQDPFRHAFYPLTLPLTVGPGAISVAITLGANWVQRQGPHLLIILTALIGSAVIAFSIFLSYAFSDRLARILGPTAMTVFMRLCSFFLVCLGVNIAWNGAQALLESLTLHVR